MRLIISPEAEAELAEAAAWYEGKRRGLGIELVVAIDRALEETLAAPLAHPLWRLDRPYRTRFLDRFPFLVFFRIEGDVMVVDAIAHTRRRPGYWLTRGSP